MVVLNLLVVLVVVDLVEVEVVLQYLLTLDRRKQVLLTPAVAVEEVGVDTLIPLVDLAALVLLF